MIRLLACGILVLLCILETKAQKPDNARSKQFTILTDHDTLQLDSQPVFKGTIQVQSGQERWVEGIDYTVDYFHSALIISGNRKGQTIQVSYRVVLFDINKSYAHKDPAIIQPEFKEIRNPFTYTPENSNGGPIIQNDGLKLNGSLSRGLTFGNNQDVVVNSNLNLQMAGKLGNDIDVLAAISDDNNPIQPEGNTQQLQDFDRVFIQLSKQQTKLTVGDFAMTRPEGSYFMNYNKKSRGLQVGSSYTFKDKSILKASGEGALSRGRFARNIINGIEGNLGPYRLSGVNGEQYIVIISGTEAVYLDGEKLRRGEQNDYVIDYNSGEVTFMPKRTITQYSRIVVEFQYSDKNYARSVFHTDVSYENKSYRLRANYYIEQDSKNQPFLQDLTDSNKLVMANAGDNISQAFAPTATPVETFSASKILYRKVDTLGYTGVFVYAEQKLNDSIFYDVKFSFVGTGKGDYNQAQSAANGRVFQWVAPVNGVSQGSYAPVTLLITPKKMQMTTVGVDVNAIKNTQVTVELAQSNYDKNLFASTDKGNDIGYGAKVAVRNMTPLQQRKENFWNIKTEAQYEFVDQNFRYVERYRSVEFDRIWNRQLTNQQNADTGFREDIVSFRTSLNKESIGSLYYQLGLYNKARLFNGYQNLVGTSLRYGRNRFTAESEFIKTENNTAALPVNNDVKRLLADYSRDVFFLTTGVKVEHEESNYRKTQDSLEQGSFLYNQLTVYTRNTDTTAIRYGVNYVQRNDYQPLLNQYKLATLAQSVNGNIDFTQKNFNRLSASFTYRQFEVNDTNFTKLKPEQTVLSRVEYDYAFIKRVFSANTYFQLGSGQELRRDFQYLEVPAGQGIYVWKDFNGDGVQGLNEFVLASSTDKLQANFIKVFLPTNTVIKTNSNQFNQTLNINPNIVWNNKTGIKKFAARWNNQTALRLDRKTTALDAAEFLNPFTLNIRDSNIIAVSSTIRNTLFFNRADPTFGFDVNYQNNKSKSYLTNGFDTRDKEEKGANIRWNWSKYWGTTIGYTFGDRSYSSDFFAENNYRYHFDEIKPKIIYQATQNLRATALFSYFIANNRPELGNQRGENTEIGAELRYNVAKQGVINSKVSLYKVSFNGDLSSPLGYDMLQGLSAGDNYVWNINYQQRLANNLQITISYDGRKSENQPVINIGRMEARYLF
jgi:hypothetical protein